MADPGALTADMALARVDRLERILISVLARLDRLDGNPDSTANGAHRLDRAIARIDAGQDPAR